MSKLLFCRGCPGSGKSTYTKQLLVKERPKMIRICKDELRLMLHQTHEFGLPDMSFYNRVIDGMVAEAVKSKRDVVLDETFTRYSDCERIVDTYLCCLGGYLTADVASVASVTILDFTKIPLDVILKQDAGRHPSLGSQVITEYFELFQQTPTENVVERLYDEFDISIEVVVINRPT